MASTISSITSRHARQIAWSYNKLKITGKVGATFERFLVLGLTILFVVFCWTFITKRILDPLSQTIGLFGILLHLAGRGGLRSFFVNVPKLVGVLVSDKITGRIHVFVTGFWGNIKFPWETYSYEEDFISLRPVKVQKSTTFLTKDGVSVMYTWSVSMGPYAPLLLLFVRNESEEMEGALAEVIESVLSAIISSKESIQLRNALMTKEIYSTLENKLSDGRDYVGNTIEQRYGGLVEIPTISPPFFAQDYNEAMMAEVVMTIIQKNAKQMADELKIPPGDALNAVMMLNKEDIKKIINEVTAGANLVTVLREVLASLGITIDEWLKKSRGNSN